MGKQINVGDETWIGNVVNQFQGVNLMVLDQQQVERMLVEAFVKSLPEIVSQPQVVAHIRDMASDAVKDTKQINSVRDVEEIAQRMWGQAEPEVAHAVASLVKESHKTVDRVLERVTPDFIRTTVEFAPKSREPFEIYVEKGQLLEFRPRGPENADFHVYVFEPGGIERSDRTMGRSNIWAYPLNVRAQRDGYYTFEFDNPQDRYGISVEFDYRVVPSRRF